MREICQSGSEGGARFYSLLLPLSRASPRPSASSYRQVLESGNLLPVSPPQPLRACPQRRRVLGSTSKVSHKALSLKPAW